MKNTSRPILNATIVAMDCRLTNAMKRVLRQSCGYRVGASVLAAGLACGLVAPAQADPFPAYIPLASLYPAQGGDGSEGFVLTGIAVGDETGFATSNAGDVNGDGIDDLIIGARFASPGGRFEAGRSYIVFGRPADQPFAGMIQLAALLPGNGGDGSSGFVLNGFVAEDSAGCSVSAAGDVNGDGIDDLIVGAYGARSANAYQVGEAFVVFGRNTAQNGNFPAALELSSLLPVNGGDGSVGFMLKGISQDDDTGRSVSAAGDVNGDGIDDLIIGAPQADRSGVEDVGQGYVVFGRDTAQTGSFPAAFQLRTLLPGAGGDGSAGFVIRGGLGEYDFTGFATSAAGDVNGDGIDDVILGAFNADSSGREHAGEAYVLFGRNTAQTGNFPAVFQALSLLPGNGGDGSAGFVLTGAQPYDAAGISVAAAGDLNGDGIGDLAIGAIDGDPAGRNAAGEAFVVFGRATAQAGNFPASFDLASLFALQGGDGSAGFVVTGARTRDQAGNPVRGAGDVNGDGIDDLAVGALDAPSHAERGESYIVFGRDTPQAGNFPPSLSLGSLFPAQGGDGSAGFVMAGVNVGDSAAVVSGAGDINSDGIDDLVIGAPNAEPGGRHRAGASYVVFGRASTPSP